MVTPIEFPPITWVTLQLSKHHTHKKKLIASERLDDVIETAPTRQTSDKIRQLSVDSYIVATLNIFVFSSAD